MQSLQQDKRDDILSMNSYDKTARRAKRILFITAALQLVPIFFRIDLPEPARTINIAVDAFPVIVFCGLAFWAARKPFYAVVGGLVFYSLATVAFAIIGHSALREWPVIKFIIYALLIAALSNSQSAKRWLDSKELM